jgi:hypothetical protein
MQLSYFSVFFTIISFVVDCYLWWGDTSSQHCSLCCSLYCLRMKANVTEWDQLGLTPNLTTRDLWRSRRWARKWEFCLYILWDFKSSFTCRKILRHGTFPLYFPSKRKVCCGFLSPFKKSIDMAEFEPATFGSSDKHINHYTTNATIISLRSIMCKL